MFKNTLFAMSMVGLCAAAANAAPVTKTTETTAFEAQMGNASALKAGMHSLSFAFPAGGNGHVAFTAGYWYMPIDSLNVGLNLGIDSEPFAGGDDWMITLAPMARWYVKKTNNVAPFVFGGVILAFGDNNIETTAQIDLQAGFGAEYFVMKQLSIGGQIGVDASFNREMPPAPDAHRVFTFTSALNLNIYFDPT